MSSFKVGDRVANMDWDSGVEVGALGTVMEPPAEADPDYVLVDFDGYTVSWLVQRTSLEPENIEHKAVQLGKATERKLIVRDEAIRQLVAYARSGLTALGAADMIDNWEWGQRTRWNYSAIDASNHGST